MKTSGKIPVVFMGSGPVAAASLRLLQEQFIIEAVVTKPTTMHEMSEASSSPTVHCVSNKSELDELFTTNVFKSRVCILIDFGIIVNKKVIDYFPKGIINSHFSLLPELRGADPLSFAILEGKKTTGVSLMLLVEAMDEGPLLHQSNYTILPKETAPSLTEKLIRQSADDLVAIVPQWMNDEVQAYEQNETTITPTYTRKLNKDDGVLDFSKPAVVLEREIRAFADWPKSRTTIGEVEVVITAASLLEARPLEVNARAGELFMKDKKLGFYCGDGILLIERIKPAGKKEMDITGFLNGYANKIAT